MKKAYFDTSSQKTYFDIINLKIFNSKLKIIFSRTYQMYLPERWLYCTTWEEGRGAGDRGAGENLCINNPPFPPCPLTPRPSPLIPIT